MSIFFFNTFELKGQGRTITRTYRTYKLTSQGRSFLTNPVPVFVMSPFKNMLNRKEAKQVVTRKRQGRGCHYLPRIKDMLKNSDSWRVLERKDEYEYPGFFDTDKLYYCADYRKKPFVARSRAHYMNDDNQLSRASSQTQAHDICIDGAVTKLNIKRSACEGVKVFFWGWMRQLHRFQETTHEPVFHTQKNLFP